MNRFFGLTAWVFSCLGVTLLLASIVIVPVNAFACFNLSDCTSNAKSRCQDACKNTCLKTYPGGDRSSSPKLHEYQTCYNNCYSSCYITLKAECQHFGTDLTYCKQKCKDTSSTASQYSHCVATECLAMVPDWTKCIGCNSHIAATKRCSSDGCADHGCFNAGILCQANCNNPAISSCDKYYCACQIGLKPIDCTCTTP